MKRWVSGLLAVAMLTLVVSASTFAIALTRVSNFTSYASPVPVQVSNTVQIPASQPEITTSSIISFTPKLDLSFARWSLVDQSSKESKQATKTVSEELKKYTAEQLQQFGLKRVYLVANLYVDGTYRSGMPEGQFEDALYFDISSTYFSSENGAYMRRTIHHELRHLADYNMHGSYRPDDTAWKQCNSNEFTYGRGGASMYADVSYAHAAHPKTGFITGYATSGIDEDRAEVFAYYMTDASYLYKTAQDDASLSCKIQLTSKLIN